MKILVTGAGGAFGEYIVRELSKEFNVTGLYHNAANRIALEAPVQGDITDAGSLKKIFDELKPDIVVHAAAVSNPAACDQLPLKTVYEINVNATENIARLCKTYNSKLIYISTDLVYAGYRGSMLEENAKLIPISLYAETKLLGEVKIQQTFENYLILRTALMFGFSNSKTENHFQKMYLSFRNNKTEKLFPDQFRTPISFFDAAEAIYSLCKLDASNQIINLGGHERVSRAQLGLMLCNIAGFDKKLIKKVSMEDVQGTYKVADVSLNTDKLQSFGIKAKSLKNSIKQILDNIPFNYQ